MKNMKKLYLKHAMCLLPCFSFDETSISGDYDMGLNENKTVCERTRVKKTLKRENNGIFFEKTGKSAENYG